MAHLIQIRDRIRAIETIYKITHAMRLVSMSHHSRLKKREQGFSRYVNDLNHLFLKVKAQVPLWQHPVLQAPAENNRQLVLIVGTQKGLCGNFNNVLFRFIEHKIASAYPHPDIIAIGKKAIEYVREMEFGNLIYGYPFVSLSTIQDCIDTIKRHIAISNAAERYSNCVVIYNEPKTFFIQVPRVSTLIPFLQGQEHIQQAHIQDETLEALMLDYIWPQAPEEILSVLADQCFDATLHNILFRSLLAEQAARFISMDGATRNAKTLLETTRLQYNKLRQAKITREIVELSEVL